MAMASRTPKETLWEHAKVSDILSKFTGEKELLSSRKRIPLRHSVVPRRPSQACVDEYELYYGLLFHFRLPKQPLGDNLGTASQSRSNFSYHSHMFTEVYCNKKWKSRKDFELCPFQFEGNGKLLKLCR